MEKGKSIKKVKKKPWSTKAAMTQVYEQNLWGTGESKYYSGIGSYQRSIVKPYIAVVQSFLNSFANPLIVCDLGCGDFTIGKELADYANQYIAVDIVEGLINYNKETFIADNIEFLCLDIATDPLPAGDCVVLRQVLQHLSNDEIYLISRKLTSFKYVLLTEHIPVESFTPNRDILSGQGTRLKKGSGVDVLAPPFNLTIKEEKELLSINETTYGGIIRTVLYTMF